MKVLLRCKAPWGRSIARRHVPRVFSHELARDGCAKPPHVGPPNGCLVPSSRRSSLMLAKLLL